MALAEPSPHHYGASKVQLRNRLHRIEGQVRGIERMVDEDRCCTDVITQIGALQAALDKVALAVLDEHTRHRVAACLREDEPDELTDELVAAVARLLRRG